MQQIADDCSFKLALELTDRHQFAMLPFEIANITRVHIYVFPFGFSRNGRGAMSWMSL